jgi:hypothetical protein
MHTRSGLIFCLSDGAERGAAPPDARTTGSRPREIGAVLPNSGILRDRPDALATSAMGIDEATIRRTSSCLLCHQPNLFFNRPLQQKTAKPASQKWQTTRAKTVVSNGAGT